MPSFCRILAGTDICPCAVNFDWARAIAEYYHGNARGVVLLTEMIPTAAIPHRMSGCAVRFRAHVTGGIHWALGLEG